MSGSTVSAAWAPVLILSTIIFYCRSLCQWSLGMDTKCTPSSLWETWLEKQAETTKGYLSSEKFACRDRSQIIDLDRGSGHRSCTCTVNLKNFFLLLCQPFYNFMSFSFFFFLLYSSVAQTLKNVGPLDCNLRLRFGDAPLAARFRSRRSCTCWLWTFSQRTFVRFLIVFVPFFIFFFSFIFSLTFFFPFFFSVVTSNFLLWVESLGVHLDLDVICSTAHIVVALKAADHCAMGKRAGVFGAHTVQGHRRWSRPRQGLLGTLEKTWAWGCLQT